MILWYNNRHLAAMAAILHKNFLRWDFWGLCTMVLSGYPSNFPENFSF